MSRVADVSLVPRDAIPGEGPGLLVTPAGQLGLTISYEVFFSERARSAVRAGADILLVPTNAASFTGAAVPAEEIAAARLRAVETGRAVVQAASTGYSALIGPDGEVRRRSQLEEPAVLRVDVARRTGLTPFVRTGNLPILGVAALVLLGSSLPTLLARPLLRQALSPVVRPVHRRFRGA